MSDYMVFNPQTEVSGRVMALQLAHFGKSTHSLLDKYGIERQPNPAEWYSQKTWLDILRDAVNNYQIDLMHVGSRLAQSLPVPDGAFSIHSMIDHLYNRYHAAHRHLDAPHFTVAHHNPEHITITDHSPYPDDFIYGLFYGLFSEFLPYQSKLTIRTTNSPRGVIYDVMW